jgi:hypothetical protein
MTATITYTDRRTLPRPPGRAEVASEDDGRIWECMVLVTRS